MRDLIDEYLSTVLDIVIMSIFVELMLMVTKMFLAI